MRYKLLLALLLLLALMAYRSPEFPKVLVVVLSSQQNKITHYETKGEGDNANMIRKEAEQVMLCTINDFTDNFSVYPVYYVIDTNLTLLRAKKFQGILLDKDRNVINGKKLDTTDFYMIVRYIYKGENVTSEMMIWGPNFEKVKKYPESLAENQLKDRRVSDKYNFTSRNFNISYKACAEALEDLLRNRIRRDRYATRDRYR